MTDFLEEKKREINARLKELRPLVDEYHRLDRSDREINIGYSCVITDRSIVLIGQSDFNSAGRSKDRRNDLACNAFVVGAHSHHSNEVHFECKVFHGGANSHISCGERAAVPKAKASGQGTLASTL